MGCGRTPEQGAQASVLFLQGGQPLDVSGLYQKLFALGLVFYLAGPALIDVMSTSPEVREAAREFLIWAAIAPVIGVASWMFDGIYIGATWTRDMRQAMIHSVGIYVLSLFILVPAFGNHGLWAALMVLNIARGVTLGWRYPKLEAQVA